MELRQDLFYKSSPKQNLKNLFKKIPAQVLDEMPQIRDAFHPGKRPYINGIKKNSTQEYIRLNKQMDISDIKMFRKIKELKELIYEISKEDYKEEQNNISKENERFEKNYKKIKKEKNKFNRGNYLDYQQFLNISSQYIAKNMKVPNLSDEHNLFSGNPLILQGAELEDFILYNFGEKSKSIKFLKKLDEYVEKKLEANYKKNINKNEKLEKLEQLKKKEKLKGHIPLEEEIQILKNDISNCEQTYKNLAEFEEFFKPRKKKLKIIKSLNKQNNRSFNNSIEHSDFKNFMWRITSNFKNEKKNQNNSLITSTTSINITRKSSPKNSNKVNVFNYNNFPKNFHLKFPKLEASLRTPSNIFNINNSYKGYKKLKIKKISFNSSLKIDSNSVSRNNKPFQIFKSAYYKNEKSNSRLYNIAQNSKMYKLLQLSNIYSNNDNKKENYFFSIDSDASEIMELNKEISDKHKNMEENNYDENIKSNLDDSIKIKEQKPNKENNINNISLKNIINPNIPKLEEKNNINNKEKANKNFDENYNKTESLFNLIKNKFNNKLKKETKKNIESYISSKGKNVETILTTKSSYNRLHHLINKSKDKNLILEEYAIRKNNYNEKEPLSKKQRIILDKNLGFIKEMIKQKTKFNEILFRDKSK